MNIENIWQEFINLENRSRLFDEKICGIYFWKIIRFQLFQYILVRCGHVQKINNQVSKNKIKILFEFVKNSFLYSAFKNKEEVDILVFENPRKIKQNSNYYDPYTKYFIDQLERDKLSYQIIDEGFRGRHFESASKKRFFSESLYFDLLKKITYYLNVPRLKESERELINNIASDIWKIFGFDVPLEGLVMSNIRNFSHQWEKYQKLFSLKNPGKIFLVCSYGKEGMIHAAKEMGIEVVEFQHGTMSKYHLGYSFPGYSKIPYFPDKIMMFGKFWYDSTPLPIEENNVKYIGFEDLNKEIDKVERNAKDQKKILFISQWTIGRELSKKAVEIAKNNKEFKVVYRLHPGECDLWEKNYLELFQNVNLENLYVDCGDLGLYKQLRTSAYVVGVYSTAIFEALTFKCKVILFDLPGIEYVDHLVENNYVIKMDIQEELSFDKLLNVKTIDREYLFGDSLK